MKESSHTGGGEHGASDASLNGRPLESTTDSGAQVPALAIDDDTTTSICARTQVVAPVDTAMDEKLIMKDASDSAALATPDGGDVGSETVNTIGRDAPEKIETTPEAAPTPANKPAEISAERDWESDIACAAIEDATANFDRWHRFADNEGKWFELQALGVKDIHGSEYATVAHTNNVGDAVKLLEDIERYNPTGIYVIANRINNAVTSRSQPHKWQRARKGGSTTDKDIIARQVLFIDVDAERPSGTSATADEVALTVDVAGAVIRRLAGILGDDSAIGYGHSGNGRQVYLALDSIPESPEVGKTIRGILVCLQKLYNRTGAKIDNAVFDAKRLVPAFGTMKRKGAVGVAERPHRPTGFTCGTQVRRLDLASLNRVFDALRADLPSAAIGQIEEAAKLKSRTKKDSVFRRANDLPVQEVAEWLGLVESGQPRCPGCGNTEGVGFTSNGLKCFHETCLSKGVPNKGGFRTPVDLVMEAKGVNLNQAAEMLATQFGFAASPDPNPDWAINLLDESDEDEYKTPLGFTLTDSGNGERFVAAFGRDVRYCGSWNKWLVWDGKHWELDVRNAVLGFTKEVARGIVREAALCTSPNDVKKIRDFALKSESARAREAMVRMVSGEKRVSVAPSDLDLDPWLLSCANGTIDLRSGELRSHRREDLITKVAPVSYDPQATCPRWDQFIHQTLGGDQALIDFVQRAIGYAITGDPCEQVLFFLYGNGANGKSTFLGVLQKILGDYAASAAPNLLVAKNNESHPTEIADLFGKRLVVCQELESGRSFAESVIKQLTGGDVIKARRMREDFWSFMPTHKLLLASNHKPNVRNNDYGMWRRIRLIPFTVTVPDNERDARLQDKLLEEAPGILRWAVDGCLRWQRQGLVQPEAVLSATSEYRSEQDLLGQFLDECCIVVRQQGFTIDSRDLYRAYCGWCEDNHYHPLNQRALGGQLREKGFEPTRGGGGVRRWSDIRLKIADDAAAEPNRCMHRKDWE